jgi:hypothetical protein
MEDEVVVVVVAVEEVVGEETLGTLRKWEKIEMLMSKTSQR